MSKITMQEYADAIVAPQYKQPLMTLREAGAKVGWEPVDRPLCCGQEVEIRSFLGAYYAGCEVCGKFIADVTGPTFSNGGGCAYFVDSDKVDIEGAEGRTWIAGVKPK